MDVWKLTCHFCSDTVSTGKLNREYYRMHLEAVHNIQQSSGQLLAWVLSTQGQEQDQACTEPSSSTSNTTLSAVANIMNMKGISIGKSTEADSSLRKSSESPSQSQNQVSSSSQPPAQPAGGPGLQPAALLNMAGITVQ